MTLVDAVRATAGIQAQVQSSAEMAIWTRRRATTRDDVRRALWETRDLVKTSAMRLTLHLIPARDFAVYIAAMRPYSMATLARWHARMGAKTEHVRAMIDTVVESLAGGALTQQELIARAKTRAGKGVRAWLDHAWSAVRPADDYFDPASRPNSAAISGVVVAANALIISASCDPLIGAPTGNSTFCASAW